MSAIRLYLAILTGLSATFSVCAAPLHSFAEIQSARKDLSNDNVQFDVTGVVVSAYKRITGEWVVSLYNGTAENSFFELNEPGKPAQSPEQFRLLDSINVCGHLYKYQGMLHPGYVSAVHLSSAKISSLPLISPKELYEPQNLRRLVRLQGLVRDISPDDSDANFLHLTLCKDSSTAQVLLREMDIQHLDPLRYIGAQITVVGICSENPAGQRQHIGRVLYGSDFKYTIICDPPATFSNAPNLHNLDTALPQQIESSGCHQTHGHVLCAWGKNQVLVRSDEGNVIRVSLQSTPLPRFGQRIHILGLPATDFYHLKLLHAQWREAGNAPIIPDAAEDKTPDELLTNQLGRHQLMVRHYGKSIRMAGTVLYLPDSTHPDAPMQLDINSQLVPVDASAQPQILSGLEIGSRVAVSGTCVMDTDDWNIDSSLKGKGGFFLVPRIPEDIVVLSRPPWWTTGRLMALLGIFAAALLGVVGWNVSLNRRAKAKGKELAAEQLAHVTSELKVNERTRLAVELHDALSQTLTGVSMQIDTAAGFAKGKVPAISKCLAIASRTIDACRMELRNTLWDLRSAALDEPIMDAAIRKTLCQNLTGIDLSVRFNVPRETFSDNTAHAVLKIIRELAANALRHGKATSLKIAGTIDDGKLLFSVRDNGYGFDPDLAPGISQGHFGLQGITERLERLNGEMMIESTPGKGAKVTVTLPIPRSGE